MIPAQQQAPMNIGLPPVFTSFTISVFSTIAAIASTMKNLLSVFTYIYLSINICYDIAIWKEFHFYNTKVPEPFFSQGQEKENTI